VPQPFGVNFIILRRDVNHKSASHSSKFKFICVFRCIAKVSHEAFWPYYSMFMPGVKSILMSASGPEQSILRGKAIECAGLIGESVDSQLFAVDATEIMQIILTIMVCA